MTCIHEMATRMYNFTTLYITATNTVHRELDIGRLSRNKERKHINPHQHPPPVGWYKCDTDVSRWDSTGSTTVSYVCKNYMTR